MLPETPLLQLIPARALTLLKRIEAEIWGPSVPLDVEWAGSGAEHVSLPEAEKRKLKKINKPFFWGKIFDQAWFRITCASDVQDGSWYLEWKEQGESTAYINGTPWAGLDVAHLTCPIPADTHTIWMEVMCLETGIWLNPPRRAITEEGCRFEGARARQRNDLAWSVYHDLDVLLKLLADEHERTPSLHTPFGRAVGYVSPLEDVSVLYRRLCRILDEVVNAYESGGLSGASRSLKAAYQRLAGQSETVTCALTGHAHIDLVWLWTETAGEFKAVHTFSTVNRLMDQYPEFRFGYSQPASYRAVERRSPALMKEVRKRIRQKKWEALGAAEVESDTQIACGEALARSLILGQEGFKDLQGKPSRILWLPDVFGYTGCLPQILRQTGVDWFFTTKLHWGSITPFPYSSFIWRGTDGSEVLAHISQGMGYNQNITPQETRGAVREFRQSDVSDEFLMPSGFGDGGGGPTPEMCERARRMADLAGTPKTAWTRIDDFFERLTQVQKRLPVYRGELYLQYHRGVLTTHGDLKALFRGTERSLQAWEAAHCLSGKGAIDQEAWRRLVFAQFHDYIPGSSIPEVYEEALPELAGWVDRGQCEAEKTASGRSKKSAMFNPLPLARRVQWKSETHLLPPLSRIPLDQLASLEQDPVTATKQSLKNQRLSVRFDRLGRIQTLRVDGKTIPAEGPLADLFLYVDQPHYFPAWDIDRSTLSNPVPVKGRAVSAVEETDDSSSVVFTRQITETSSAAIRYTLRPHAGVLEIEYEIDWQDPEHLLKVHFPTAYNGDAARFGAPFGSTLRSQQPGQAYDEAQWEVAGSRWAVVSDDGEPDGLMVMTEAKYGWSCRSGILTLSLLRSARMPSIHDAEGGGGATGPGAVYSDITKHRIRIAVGRYRSDAPREEQPAALADLLYTPAIPVQGQPADCGFLGLEGGETLIPSWARPEGKSSWVLRLHETMGRRGTARLNLTDGVRAEAVDLSGNPVNGVLKKDQIHFTPYQIISLRIQRR